jgi:hypothetical protein
MNWNFIYLFKLLLKSYTRFYFIFDKYNIFLSYSTTLLILLNFDPLRPYFIFWTITMFS